MEIKVWWHGTNHDDAEEVTTFGSGRHAPLG